MIVRHVRMRRIIRTYFFRHLKMGRQWLVACVLLSTVVTVRAYSTGAPAAACARIYPEGHNGTSLSLSSSPFVLDISQLYNQLGNIYYTPGYSYTRKHLICVAYKLLKLIFLRHKKYFPEILKCMNN